MQGSSMQNKLIEPATLTFDLWTPKQYHFLGIPRWFPTQSLDTSGSFVFELCCGQRNRQTDWLENPTHLVGVGNNYIVRVHAASLVTVTDTNFSNVFYLVTMYSLIINILERIHTWLKGPVSQTWVQSSAATQFCWWGGLTSPLSLHLTSSSSIHCEPRLSRQNTRRVCRPRPHVTEHCPPWRRYKPTNTVSCHDLRLTYQLNW